jgi:plasmid maintenance system antidote protein VapI
MPLTNLVRFWIEAGLAVRVGKFCGNGPGLWLRMQEAHDLWHAERALDTEIKAIPTVRTAA